MQLNEDINNSQYQIQAYQPGEITINNQTYRRSLIITPDTLITDWHPRTVEEITKADIEFILALKAEIILLGTGAKPVMPPAELRQFDCMENGAACRTFVALSAEGRNVAAALLIEDRE